MEVEIVEMEGTVLGKCGASHCIQWELCGVVIFCHAVRGGDWRRGSPRITLGFLVSKQNW